MVNNTCPSYLALLPKQVRILCGKTLKPCLQWIVQMPFQYWSIIFFCCWDCCHHTALSCQLQNWFDRREASGLWSYSSFRVGCLKHQLLKMDKGLAPLLDSRWLQRSPWNLLRPLLGLHYTLISPCHILHPFFRFTAIFTIHWKWSKQLILCYMYFITSKRKQTTDWWIIMS